jgi:hypothetical protein
MDQGLGIYGMDAGFATGSLKISRKWLHFRLPKKRLPPSSQPGAQHNCRARLTDASPRRGGQEATINFPSQSDRQRF